MNKRVSSAAPALFTLAASAALIFVVSDSGRDSYPPRTVGHQEVAAASSVTTDAQAVAGEMGVRDDFHAEVSTLKRRLEAALSDTAALLRLGRLMHDAHRPEEAADHYRRYLELNPGDRQVWLDLANVYAAARRWEQAKEATEVLLAIDPADAEAMYNLGAIQANLGRYSEARSWWKKIEREKPGEPLALLAASAMERLPATDR